MIEAKPSGSSIAMNTVSADAFTRGAGLGHVEVALQYFPEENRTLLLIESGDAVTEADRGAHQVVLELRLPDSLRALISALLELAANPHGAAMLSAIGSGELD